MSKKQFEEWLLAGEMCVSLINEPIIDFEVPPLTALERARRRWSQANVIEGRMEGAKHEPD